MRLACSYCLRRFEAEPFAEDGSICPHCGVDAVHPGEVSDADLEREHVVGFGAFGLLRRRLEERGVTVHRAGSSVTKSRWLAGDCSVVVGPREVEIQVRPPRGRGPWRVRHPGGPWRATLSAIDGVHRMLLFDELNDALRAFVARNPRLRPGTGEYSVPFRGTLFGTNVATEVAARLADARVDVLWLGSNPNVPSSVAAILRGVGDDHRRFEAHLGSGLYAPAPVGRTTPWEPATARGGWAVYLAALPRRDLVAFANVIPWGSSVAAEFLDPLRKEDPELHDAVIRFSLEQLERIKAALRPRLVLVPFSVARSRSFAGTDLAERPDDETHRVPGTTFRCRLRRGPVPTLFVRHPSSLRLSAGNREAVTSALASVVTSVVEGDG